MADKEGEKDPPINLPSQAAIRAREEMEQELDFAAEVSKLNFIHER